MTRHNLDSHIAWLLSNQVIPRAAVLPVFPTNYPNPTQEINQQILDTEQGEGQEVDFVSSSLRSTRIAPDVNVVQAQREFVRPPLPIFSSLIVADMRNTPVSSRKPQDVPMARLVSAPKSSRPALMSQIQLATPASTTSTAGPSSLAQAYKTQLCVERQGQASGSTSSMRNSGDQAPNKTVRALQTPQTPRQTPRQNSVLTSERVKVESVDLTGDDYGAAMLRSSSSDVIWGESEELWSEPAATRPEPVSQTSKKRKSDDISTPGPVKRTNSRNTPTRKVEMEDTNMDDFVDIDEFDLPPSRPTGIFAKPSGSGTLKASIETSERMVDIQEQMEFTETVTRTETRTRKSVSRVPSVTGAIPGRTVSEVQIPGTPSLGIFSDAKSRPVSMAGVSPTRHNSPRTSDLRTPQKQTSHRFKTEIQDSDDEECLSDIERIAACSPTPVKKSPSKVRSRSPSTKPGFAAPEHKLRNPNDSRPRVGSPLRPISINNIPRQEKIPTPFHQDSPSRRSRSGKSSESQASQSVSRSSTDLDDKKVIDAYLAKPATINVYRQRVSNLLIQSSIACMAFVDKQEAAPEQLKDQRISLLDMSKAYEALEALGKQYQITHAKKLKVAKEVLELLELSVDASEQEEIALALTRELRAIRTEVGQLLHRSGAVKDGFGTGYSSRAAFVASPIKEVQDALNSGTNGSAQIIMQTQFTSLPNVSTASSAKVSPAKVRQGTSRVASPSRYQSEYHAPRTTYDQASPSHVRATNSARFTEQPYYASRESHNQPKQSSRQPSFRRDPSPAPYDFDDEAFEDLLDEEQDIVNSQNHWPAQDVVQEPEENYGDSDFGDDMEGIIQTVEKRHSSVRIPSPIRNKPSTASEGNRNVSEGSRVSQSRTRKDMYSHVDVEKSGLLKHAWSSDVKRALKERFKLGGFRYHQLEAINATLSGQDAFVLMPTGGGKSLCYQLPAIVQSGKTKGITIVISPLLSLMKDQVRHLRNLHIRAASINGETSPEEKAKILDGLNNKHPEQHVQLLYVTPEMMNKSEQMVRIFTRLYNNHKLARVVIDEAHCVSQWGHDFRPDYVALSSIREKFRGVPIMALTATATKNVQMDVIHNLGMKDCPLFAQSFNRPNLHYEVRRKAKGKSGELLEDMAKLISGKYKGQTGIIYTLSKRNCEDIASKLYKEHEIKAYHFHAGMTAEEKSDTQDQWQSGEIQVVVATIAFGMGIDKANVRFVIHHMIPKSLEGYYQETGRAGRDGLKSGCYLYYGYADTTMLRKFIKDSEASEEQKERQRKMLQSMVQYCENESDCRRVQVLRYFNETFRKEDCKNTCDNCRSEAVFQDSDFSQLATAAVQVVKQVMRSDVTLLHCVDILRGAKNKKIKDMEHAKLDQYGIAQDLERSEIERLLYRLVMEKALEEDNIMNRSGFPVQYIKLGINARGFLSGQRKITMQVQVAGGASAPAAASVLPKKAKVTKCPTSTMLTSPMSPAVRKREPLKQAEIHEDDESDYGDDMNDFIVSDNDGYMKHTEHERSFSNAFEKMQQPKAKPPKPRQLETRGGDIGPPITSDQQMAKLGDVHRVMVEQFVDAAKSLEEKIRNGTSARRPFFTESNFRQMAINWTLNLVDMKKIPDINPERVLSYGKRFLPLVSHYFTQYNAMMNEEEERLPVHDPNHQIVVPIVDLVSDEEDDFEDEMDDEDMEEQATSQYFSHDAPRAAPTRNLPWAPNHQSSLGDPKKAFSARDSFTKGRGRGSGTRKASSSRKSFGSNSGAGASSAVPKRRSSGTAKKPRARTSTGSSSKTSYEKSRYQSGGRGGGSGNAGGGGGIAPMPT